MSKILTTEELAAELKLSVDSVRLMAREGEIPAMKMKRQWRFDLEEVKAALRTNGAPNAHA